MHDLWLGSEGDVLHLDGDLVQAPLRGCLRNLDRMADGNMREILTLALEGDDPMEFDPILARVEHSLAAARIWNERGLGLPIFLGAQPLAGGETWRTPILDGWLETAGSGVEDRLRGRMQVKLHLVHPQGFEGSPVELPLTNRNGLRQTGGVSVHNHADAGHDNFVLIDEADVGGELPASLKLALAVPTGGQPLGDLLIGLNQHSDPLSFDAVLEAEAGLGGTLVPEPACSGGSYRSLAWSGVEAAELLAWQLDGTRVAACGGNAFRFLLRLAAPVTYEGLWLRLQVRDADGELLLGETDWALVRPGCSLQELGPLPLPPGELPPAVGGAPLLVSLAVQRRQEGSHEIGVDFIALVTLDGLRRYRCSVPLAAGAELVDEPGLPVAACLPGQGWLASHVVCGAPLELLPGQDARLTAYQSEPGGLAPIERMLIVRAWYRARRRFL